MRNWQKCSVIYLISGTIHYLCDVFAIAESPLGWKRARHMYIKGVTERFGFDALESRKFKQLVKNKATGTPHGMFIYSPHWIFTLLGDMLLSVFYILIGVGLSALLVSTNWAMREP